MIRGDMKVIRVKKDELLSVLKTNRTKHISEYNEALLGYREDLEKLYVDVLADVIDLKESKAIEKFKQPTNLPKPIDNSKQYDLIIGMLEMHIGDEIELDQSEYRHYVMDEWDWSAAVATTNIYYAEKYKSAL